MAPKISIILPVLNAEPFLNAALASILTQTHQEWELVAIDDGSTDQSLHILERAAQQDTRIRVVRCSKNQGAFAARNTGLDVATGAYIAFLDADDLWLPTKLEDQLRFMQSMDSGFSCTSFDVISCRGARTGTRTAPPRITREQLLLCNTIGTSTVMISRQTLGNHRFPPLRMRQDYALWLTILTTHDACLGMDKNLTQYRRHTTSLSASKLRSMIATWRVYKTVPNLSLPRSIWSYVNYLARTSFKNLSISSRK
jgi:teichuronic acid biosynthesis glycosyltransferase TuaG